jgi:hypothetical protein
MDRDALKGFGECHLHFVEGRDHDPPPDLSADLPSGDLLRRAYCTQDIVHSDEAGRASKSIASAHAPFASQDREAFRVVNNRPRRREATGHGYVRNDA